MVWRSTASTPRNGWSRGCARSPAAPNPVRIGDFADVGADGPFTLVYVVFSTFYGLQSQEEQVRCFRNVAARLAPGGAFVIEAFVPDQTRFTRGGSLECVRVETDLVMLGATRHDAASQTLVSQYVKLTEGGIRLYPAQLRYAWPSELDLMAQLAGLRLRDRWANWRREPFTAASMSHVSVYERPESAGERSSLTTLTSNRSAGSGGLAASRRRLRGPARRWRGPRPAMLTGSARTSSASPCVRSCSNMAIRRGARSSGGR